MMQLGGVLDNDLLGFLNWLMTRNDVDEAAANSDDWID